jgi:hypothetical protein
MIKFTPNDHFEPTTDINIFKELLLSSVHVCILVLIGYLWTANFTLANRDKDFPISPYTLISIKIFVFRFAPLHMCIWFVENFVFSFD